MGFLKFLFIAIAILTLLRLTVRRLLPWALKRFMRKMQDRAYGQQSQYHSTRQQSRRPEGEINIDYIPPEEKPNSGAQNAGEFVDFEEIPNK